MSFDVINYALGYTSGGGGDDVMVVEASQINTDDNITFSKTFLEVLEAYNNNKRIVMYTKGNYGLPIVFFELQAVLPNLDGQGMVHQLSFTLIKGQINAIDDFLDGFLWEYNGHAPEGSRESVTIHRPLRYSTIFRDDRQGNLAADLTPTQVSRMLEQGKVVHFTLHDYSYSRRVKGYVEFGREYGHTSGSFDICCMINEYSNDESMGVHRTLVIKGDESTNEWTLVKDIFNSK